MLNFMFPAALFLIPGTISMLAQTPTKDIASTIIAMERAALDRSDKGDTSGFLEISDPDVVYIDSFLDKPLYGLAALTAYYAKFTESGGRGEMLNAKVQVLGDTAVLTFNYKNKIRHGWNCTEVYRHTEKGWRIVQTHWSLVKPLEP
jgi:hypothetical protein